tara:strand:+ start:264 stop:452 length:189 start_codon:yes stop_codon:yes gene_type:complete
MVVHGCTKKYPQRKNNKMRKTNQKNKEQFNQVLDETFGEVSVDLSRRQHPMNSQPNEEDPTE